MRYSPAIALLAAATVFGMTGESLSQPSGGFGGMSGGGARPTGGSNWGYNRAGTASSGGFAYGDAPRMPAQTAVESGPAEARVPCNATPVTVNGTPYYKCGGNWYTAALTSTGIGYAKVAPPPGY